MTPPPSTSLAVASHGPRAVSASPAVPIARNVSVPHHLAIVIDLHSLEAPAEHTVKALRESIHDCLSRGIRWLSVFIPSQVSASPAPVYQALTGFIQQHAAALANEGVNFSALAPFTAKTQKNSPAVVTCRAAQALLAALEQSGRENHLHESLRVTLAINYSGRADIVSAIRRLADEATLGDIKPSEVGPQDLARCLCLRGLPSVDLLVRTGGDTSLSDFLLWQSAYTELLFLETPWSHFRAEHFAGAMNDYARRKRTFGALPK